MPLFPPSLKQSPEPKDIATGRVKRSSSAFSGLCRSTEQRSADLFTLSRNSRIKAGESSKKKTTVDTFSINQHKQRVDHDATIILIIIIV